MRVTMKCCEGLICFEGGFSIYAKRDYYYRKGKCFDRDRGTGLRDCFTEHCDVVVETKDARYTIKDCHNALEMIGDLSSFFEAHRDEESVVLDLYDPLDEDACYDNGEIVCERL